MKTYFLIHLLSLHTRQESKANEWEVVHSSRIRIEAGRESEDAKAHWVNEKESI